VTYSSKDSPEGNSFNYQRQFIFIVNAIAFVAGLLLYIKNPYTLFIVRILQGVCVGFYSAITPVIIKETSPNEISGTLGALNQFFIAFGCFFAFFFKFILEKAADDETG
jgi:SP family arabinose:H+ symporter-like MFS transporter